MSTTLTFAERMQHAGTGTLIGVLTVFAILMILWGLLVVMRFVFARPEKPEKAEVVNEPIAVSTKPADDTQLIAVLTAAVAMMLEAQNVNTNFRIKSFRRTK